MRQGVIAGASSPTFSRGRVHADGCDRDVGSVLGRGDGGPADRGDGAPLPSHRSQSARCQTTKSLGDMQNAVDDPNLKPGKRLSIAGDEGDRDH